MPKNAVKIEQPDEDRGASGCGSPLGGGLSHRGYAVRRGIVSDPDEEEGAEGRTAMCGA